MTANHQDSFDDLMGRIKVLADLRREAETNEFERRDRLRQQEVQSLRDEIALLRKEGQETKATHAGLASRVSKMGTHLIASLTGDITSDEVCFAPPEYPDNLLTHCFDSWRNAFANWGPPRATSPVKGFGLVFLSRARFGWAGVSGCIYWSMG